MTRLERNARHQIGRNSVRDPSDIVAEALAGFVAKEESAANRFKDTASLTYWLLRVQSNKTFDHYRKVARNRESPYEDLTKFPVTDPTSKDTVDEVIFENVMASLTEKAKLNPMERRLLLEIMYPGKPISELAEEFDITEGNVRIQIHRLRQKLSALWPKITEHLPEYQITEAEAAERSLGRKTRLRRPRSKK